MLSIVKTYLNQEAFKRFDEPLELIYNKSELKQRPNEIITPEYLHCIFLLLKDNKVVARCCLYNPDDLKFNNQIAFAIGNFECINDIIIAKSLFDSCHSEAKNNGASYLIGPMNGTTWDTYRITLPSVKSPFFGESFSPHFYPQLFKQNNFNVCANYISCIDSSPEINIERQRRASRIAQMNEVSIREINLDKFDEELKLLYSFCTDAFKNNFLFCRVSKDYFSKKYLSAKSIINPNFVLIAEDKQLNIVGFIFCIENFHDNKEKGLIIKTLAKTNNTRFGGIGQLLSGIIKERALIIGYSYIIHAFMHTQNASSNLSKYSSGNLLREYELYVKIIE